jgi:hypothetical protein
MSLSPRHPLRTISVVVVAAAATLVATPDTAEAAGPGVCAGVNRCRVVAHVDVDGNGTSDAVALARRGKNGGPKGFVYVRVKTAANRIVAVRREAPYWYGPLWQGAAALDGRKGRDLMIGRTAGAHTQFFRALTWRGGRLTNLRAPGGRLNWVVDGAYRFSLGFLRRAGKPAGTLTRLDAERNGESTTFTGTATDYRWSGGAWQRVRRSTNDHLPEKTAGRWSGFRVPGLDRF